MLNTRGLSSTLVILPGMHGTADLTGPLIKALPRSQPHRVIVYPTDRMLTYDEILGVIEDQLLGEQDVVMIGESYSGPLALRFAARNPRRVRAVVLSASFVLPPLPSWLRLFTFTALFRIPLPSFLIRLVVAGWSADEDFVAEVRRAIRRPTSEVLGGRARETLAADFTDDLRKCQAPILYLAGDRDRLVLPFNLKRILAIRPDVIVRHIDAPHLILQMSPNESWEAIKRFIAPNSPVGCE